MRHHTRHSLYIEQINAKDIHNWFQRQKPGCVPGSIKCGASARRMGHTPMAHQHIRTIYSGETLATVLGDRYEYHPEFAPTAEILAGHKDGRITWPDYERMYRELLATRHPTAALTPANLDRICLLCTEKSATQCHRRLAAEHIAEQLPDIEIVHL